MKLGLLAPIDAEAEHAEAMLRNAAELAEQEQNTVARLSFSENATAGVVFHTFADDQARRAHLERLRTRSPRTTWTRSISSWLSVRVGRALEPDQPPGTRRRSLAVNAITTDESLIEDLGDGPTVSNVDSGQHCTYEIELEIPHDGFLADVLMRSIGMIRD